MSAIDEYSRSPRGIAAIYAVVSGIYILVSDRVLAAVVSDPTLAAQVQTAKGWAFVAVSAVLIFGLVSRSRRSLSATNERLDRALQQTSVLHRILRHNLRNSCNVIAGNTDLLRKQVPADGGEVVGGSVDGGAPADAEGAPADGESAALPAENTEACLERIREQTERLVSITEKTRTLRDIVLDPNASEPVDLVAVVDARVAAMRNRCPHADIRTELPGTLEVLTEPRIGVAIGELLENAVEHNDREHPTVEVSVSQGADGSGVVEIADDGPGLPPMERGVIDEGIETPTFHSEGLGLWIARTVVVHGGGDISIVDDGDRGTTVRIELE